MNNSQQVANLIKVLIKEKNISISKMLSDCNLSKNALSSMQAGGYYPRIEAISTIADYLNVSIDYLLGRKEKATPEEEQQKTNTIKILGRDGSCVERELTDDQIDLMKKMIEQMPDANDL